MMMQQTLEKLNAMRITGMVKALREQILQVDSASLSFEERLSLLVDYEWNFREERKLQRRLRSAKFKQTACMENVDYLTHRGLNREVMKELESCRWVKAGRNIILTGPTGIGKSWLACALGEKACRDGFTVYYARVTRLVQELSMTRIDGSFLKMLERLAKTDVLILDDWALAPLEGQAQQDVLEVIDDRVGKHSIIITSQLPIEKWHDMVGDPSTADALLDRLISKAYLINLKGGSLRREGRREEASE